MRDGGEFLEGTQVCLFKQALPEPLFRRLASAVQSIGNERMSGNGSYTTTFWYPREQSPTNVAEEAIVELLRMVDPGSECIGTEWWLGRLGHGKKLNLHFDRDLALDKQTNEVVHPLYSSVFYLNDFSFSPTIILGQVLGADGKTKIPKEPEFEKSVEAVSNHYVVFPGDLRHGVLPDREKSKQAVEGEKSRKSSELRLTLLVNFWHRRPLAPICCDYDGSVYGSLKDEFARSGK